MNSSYFWSDLRAAKLAEEECLKILQANYSGEFVNVSNSGSWEERHKGDIKVLTPDKRTVYIEVKNDEEFPTTNNILVEKRINDYEKGYIKGWFYYPYEYIAFISLKARRLIIFDFNTLKAACRKTGVTKYITHPKKLQDTDGQLLSLDYLRAHNMIWDELEF